MSTKLIAPKGRCWGVGIPTILITAINLGGGFKYFLFSPLLGKDEPILTHIFQFGLVNQPPTGNCPYGEEDGNHGNQPKLRAFLLQRWQLLARMRWHRRVPGQPPRGFRPRLPIGCCWGGEPSMPSPNGGEISGEIQELAEKIWTEYGIVVLRCCLMLFGVLECELLFHVMLIDITWYYTRCELLLELEWFLLIVAIFLDRYNNWLVFSLLSIYTLVQGITCHSEVLSCSASFTSGYVYNISRDNVSYSIVHMSFIHGSLLCFLRWPYSTQTTCLYP